MSNNCCGGMCSDCKTWREEETKMAFDDEPHMDRRRLFIRDADGYLFITNTDGQRDEVEEYGGCTDVTGQLEHEQNFIRQNK